MAEPVELGAARELVRQQVRSMRSETRALAESMGFVIAETVIGPDDVPPFDKALVDGYAMLAESLSGQAAQEAQRTASLETELESARGTIAELEEAAYEAWILRQSCRI